MSRSAWMKLRSEEGASLVEMALASMVLFTLLIGIMELSMGMYCFTFAAEAAREASRYAALLGQNSCFTATSPDPICNLGPTAYGPSKTAYTTSPLQTYVQGLGLPFASQMQVDATWWSPTGATPQQWTLSCTTLVDTNLNSPLGAGSSQCNYPGHAVKVTVSYLFPLAIPFVSANSLKVQSTSMMVISE